MEGEAMFKGTGRAMLAGIVLLLAAPAARADQPVTALLRSGERVSGQLASFDQTTVDVRGDSGQRRTLPWDDVVLLDFASGARALPATEASAAREQQAVMILRGGESRRGRVVDFVDEGGERAAVIFESDRGREQVDLRNVGRIYVHPFTPEALAAAGLPAQPGAQTGASQSPSAVNTGDGLLLTVPGNTRWMGTGVFVRRGERLGMQTEGSIYLVSGGQDEASPAGARNQRRAAGAPLPAVLAGALIGRIGASGTPFGIGDQSSIVAPAAGELYLGVNDDDVTDNQGEFRVRITRVSGR
jgi:hypothetical protein